MLRIESFDSMYLDVLKEIGNIGAGNAATSLSKILGKKVGMNVPKVNIIRFNEMEDVVGGADTLVAGIYLEFSGDIEGTIMFVLDEYSAKNLANVLINSSWKLPSECSGEKEKGFSEIEVSALEEVGNILAGAYLGSLSTLTGLRIIPTVPDMAYDMVGAILSVPMIEFGQYGEHVLFIETEFIDGSDHIRGYFFLIPDMESYPVILESLGVV